MAEQDAATVAHLTYSYFVNTSEWRLSGRKDMKSYLEDDSSSHIDEETGQDTRPIEEQAKDLMSDWDLMRSGFTASNEEPVE